MRLKRSRLSGKTGMEEEVMTKKLMMMNVSRREDDKETSEGGIAYNVEGDAAHEKGGDDDKEIRDNDKRKRT